MKMRSHKILRVRGKGFTLTCRFDDGSVVLYDMKWLLKESGPMIESLRDKKFFAKAFVEAGSISWPNGYDICPNLIYREGTHLSSKKAAA